jgi:hypothetical protein
LPACALLWNHGPTFDIAGTGKADERSLVEAMRQPSSLLLMNPMNDREAATPLIRTRGTLSVNWKNPNKKLCHGARHDEQRK